MSFPATKAARHDRDRAGGAPKYLIADEPTTALDVTIQAQILDLIKSLRDSENIGVSADHA